ncbi:MAG: ABC transporter ATP-binding protein [Clostridiales bacterium]|nr:ABC transporter ATP-binding protein [Clostridiales bacterium]
MAKELLKIENLNVIYKTDMETVYAVNGIDLSINEQETLGLVGETGAGKTSTALAILRLLPDRTAHVTDGKIYFEGQDVAEMDDATLRAMRGGKISMIFQDPMTSLNPVITVGRQIAEALVLHNTEGKTKEQIEDRVEEILELVGIPASRKNDYPHQFSGGMKQRVVIAIALSCNPKLLIADEPTTALDVTIQAQVLAMMNELKEKLKTSLLMITHDMGIIAQTCEKVGVMYAGEIIEYGSVEDLFEGKYHHPYTEGLFNSIPNIEETRDRLEQIDGLMPDPTNLPKGCKFNPRCKKCMEICKEKEPPVYQEGQHRIKCHLYGGMNQ